MKRLLMLKGLPASGKSTRARELVETEGFTRVNKDDLRAMLHNGKWTRGNEKVVLALRDHIVRTSLAAGRNVVVDDTNFEPVHEETLRQIAQDNRAAFSTEFIDTPLEVCIERDAKRANGVGEAVIREKFDHYLRQAVSPQPIDPTLPFVVLCDIDGTIAHMTTRKRFGRQAPYAWKYVGEDALDGTVYGLLCDLDTPVIMMSGRDEVCRPETTEWLERNGVEYVELFMRPADDSRKDALVKRELYEQHIQGKYNVLFVLDDRNQVVDMWRNELGLRCLQVAEGNF